ncbi:MAG: complex I NDUFA9 subunit family protein [Chloroflexi bacterium]|nr:complex I NDUFA9 subunit family protein [Chloroflexota bacterium]
MILLTGATGFVGRHLLARLVTRGERVRCLVHRLPVAGAQLEQGVVVARGSVADPASLHDAMVGVDTVIHLVAVIRETRSTTFAGINVQGTRNVLAAAKEAGVRRVFHMGALGASPNAAYPFTYSKWLAEEAVRHSGMPYTILEPSIIFGEGDEFVTKLAGIVRLSPFVPIIGTGANLFQPIWVEDVVTCVLKSLDDDSFLGKTIQVGGPEHLSYEQIVDEIARALGKRGPKLHIPLALIRPMVRAMETLLPSPPITTAQLAMLSLKNVTDLDSVPTHFGFTPAFLRDKLGHVSLP